MNGPTVMRSQLVRQPRVAAAQIDMAGAVEADEQRIARDDLS